MSTDIQSTGKPIEILFSYAREDETLRDKLEKHLSSLKRSGKIVCWHDRGIRAGASWELELSTHLESADIVLLLISADFIDSEYCYTIEMGRALERHKKGETCVIPVILKPTDWHDEEFAKLQALPRDGKSVASWSNVDEALLSVAQGIKAVVVELEKKRAATP